MELEDLEGPHMLSGVDRTVEIYSNDDGYIWGKALGDVEAPALRFVLDGVTYKVVENPDDGWRSSMRDILVSDEKVNNTFKPHKVIARMLTGRIDGGIGDKNNILEFTDASTGETVLSVGTGNTDDYYPYCVLYWNPENLAINKEE